MNSTFTQFSRSILFCIMATTALNTAVNVHAVQLVPVELRTEWLPEPLGVDTPSPRLSWRVESDVRGDKQTAYRILVANNSPSLDRDQGDLWDSGKIGSDETLNITYAGKPLASGQRVYWKVKVWDKDGQESQWSRPASWGMGLLHPEDWTAQWISFRDHSPVYDSRQELRLPPARYYRKDFRAEKPVARAMLYFSTLGIGEMHLNGTKVGDALFEPGWADYHKRVHYRAHDVTSLLASGANALGAIVADGWYAGYLGYGLLAGLGPNKTGREIYGKTPALLAQLRIEYADGSRETIITDPTWQVSGDGPIREADFLMGEFFDARLDRSDWCASGSASDWKWESAIRAEDNGPSPAIFFDNRGSREVDLGFQKPPKLQYYAAPPIRITQELPAQNITEPTPGVYIFDLGQNFAGIVRLKVKGSAGTRIQLRHGEKVYPDGRLMTENLRRARATDTYILKGDPNGETWSPRFTYHGFQYVEVSGLEEMPSLETVTGLVLHNDTPLIGTFECSDEVLSRFWKNTQWTQRANFIEVPTDCPQRDERFGWMGDAQAYIRTASFNADVAAFFTKWLDDVEEAQHSYGAYPDYCPYPMGHGSPRRNFGTAWTDAGIICPWTVWQVYGDTRTLERHWDSMTRFMDWRIACSPDNLGRSLGNPWGDWLNINESTPVEYIDTCYYAYDAQLMADMAQAIHRPVAAENYLQLFNDIKAAFAKEYVNANGSLKIDTQTAYALALAFDLFPSDKSPSAANRLAEKIAQNDYRMATGFIGTKVLLPALSASGKHDLAARLFQSRRFPSWGYEVVNGANTVWERWDSYTKEHGFEGAAGSNNASMNSFSHYAFGAVMEWAFRDLTGIDTDGPGYKHISIKPNPPASDSNPENTPIHWVHVEYGSARGPIVSRWKREENQFRLDLSIPANTTATVFLPSASIESLTEDNKPLNQVEGVKLIRIEDNHVLLEVVSGRYFFQSKS